MKKALLTLLLIGISISLNAQSEDNFEQFGIHLNWLIAKELKSDITIPKGKLKYSEKSGKTDNDQAPWDEFYSENSLLHYLKYDNDYKKIILPIHNKIDGYRKNGNLSIKHAEELIKFGVAKLEIENEEELTSKLKRALSKYYEFELEDSNMDTKDFQKYYENGEFCLAYSIGKNKDHFTNLPHWLEIKENCKKENTRKLQSHINDGQKDGAHRVLKFLLEESFLTAQEEIDYKERIERIGMKKGDFSWVWHILPWLFTSMFALIAVIFWSKGNQKSKSEKNDLKSTHQEERKELVQRYNESVENLNSKIISLEKEVQSKDEQIKSLESQIQDLKAENEDVIDDSMEESLYTLSGNQTNSIELSPTKNIKNKYLSMSLPGGRFVKCLDSIQEGRTYFKLEISSQNENKGSFNVITGNPFITKSLLQNVRDYLKPVCEIENEYTDNPTRIELIKNGIAVKLNNSWEMKEKAKIKLV